MFYVFHKNRRTFDFFKSTYGCLKLRSWWRKMKKMSRVMADDLKKKKSSRSGISMSVSDMWVSADGASGDGHTGNRSWIRWLGVPIEFAEEGQTWSTKCKCRLDCDRVTLLSRCIFTCTSYLLPYTRSTAKKCVVWLTVWSFQHSPVSHWVSEGLQGYMEVAPVLLESRNGVT